MELNNPALTFAFALAAGIIAQTVARHLRLPGIVLLLAAGVLLGPEVAGIVRPETLGSGLPMIVGLAVAVILFEGGLNLNLERLRREARVIRRLVTVGALVTAVGGTIAARAIMGWDWRLAALFGTLVIVTGPTVITPLLRRIKVTRNLSTILEAEGVLIDPIGAMIAVVTLEVVITPTSTVFAEAAVDLVSRLGFGVLAGAAGGFVLGALLRYERVLPEGLHNVFTLGLVLAMFQVSNAVLHESGIMTVTVAGLVVGNMRTHVGRELHEFKEQLTVMLIGLLFVLLAADVALGDVVSLGWPGVLTVVVLMVIVRPLDALVSTWGTGLGRNERVFLAWLAPRGIVAAAVASLFAQELSREGVLGGTELRALVFLVIAATVVIQGLPSGWVATLLGVRRPYNTGYVIVGANILGRTLGRLLAGGGEEVVLVDLNADMVQTAQEEGFRVVYGNANEESVLLRTDIEARKALLAMTPNEGVNLLLAQRARRVHRVPRAYVMVHKARPGVQESLVNEAGAATLFAGGIEIDLWAHRLHQGTAVPQQWIYEGPGRSRPGFREEEDAGLPGNAVIAVTVTRGKKVRPADNLMLFRRRDLIDVLVYGELRDRVSETLLEQGFRLVEVAEAPEPEPAGAAAV